MKKVVFVFLSLLNCFISYGQLPDSDGDGVIDSEDACPFEKGVKENKGCPLQISNKNKVTSNSIKPKVAPTQSTDFLKVDNLKQVIDALCENKQENFKYPGYKNDPGEVILTTFPKNGLANNLDVYYKTNGKGGYQVFLPLSEKEADFNAVLKQVAALSEKTIDPFCSFYGFTFNVNRTNDSAFAVVAVMDKETTWQMGLYKHLSAPGKKIVLLSIVKFKSESSKNENGKNEGYINSNEFLNGNFSKTSNTGAPVQKNGVIRKSIGVIFDSMPANRILIVAKGGPADKAGFKTGDEVVKINGSIIPANNEFVNFIRRLDDKEHVFEVKRNKEVKTLKIKKAEISSFTQKCLSGDCKNGQGAYVYSSFDYYEGGF
ncbi:MAG: PDZ domain-containing protein, partial [Chitinophagaceae bacterium]